MWREDYFRETYRLRGDPPPFDSEQRTWETCKEIDAPRYYWIQLLPGLALR